ncbi:MAG TPA: dihydroxyacetone kinase subunit DhaL [Ktedonobacteraceae bacterium]|jgi:dihydroxyacetone kinase-like protein|nr:dihydroxyacetone kinase subunit DhaL [Ktedonobacteraceae bacterium]
MPITTEDTLSWLQQLALVLQENREYLTQLDSAIGDADHGINMDRGFKAVAEKLPTQAEMDIGSILKLVGTTLVSTVGGASGPLYGTAFLRAGMAMAGKRELYEADYIALLEAALEGIKARGKAQPGEKTMLDALAPALTAARAAEAEHPGLVEITRRASEAAEAGMKATIPLVATKGRASYLGERSAGHQDPGATSSWLILKTLADTCAARSNKT